MSNLVVVTIVPGEPGSGEGHRTFAPGDEVPEWAARHMGAHCFEDGVHPYPEADPDESDPAESVAIPPKAGPGASTDAWKAYADGKVEVADAAKREDIIAALVDAGHPVE